MKRYTIPDMFRAEDSDILGALEKVATAQGLSGQEAERVFALLPDSLKNAPSFKDRMTGIWRYEYGIPYVVGKGNKEKIVIGTDQAPKVSVLLNGIRALSQHTPYEQLLSFCKKLENKHKHLDFLAELDPLMRPSVDFTADYEPDGYASGNRKIDWLIRFHDGSSCLIDVKNRIRGLIDFFDGINRKGKNNFSDSPPLPDGVFNSSEIKFLPAKKGRFQGLWLLTSVYYDDELLKETFYNLDENLMQFTVLTHFEGEARILSRKPEIKSWLIEKFCLNEMKRRK